MEHGYFFFCGDSLLPLLSFREDAQLSSFACRSTQVSHSPVVLHIRPIYVHMQAQFCYKAIPFLPCVPFRSSVCRAGPGRADSPMVSVGSHLAGGSAEGSLRRGDQRMGGTVPSGRPACLPPARWHTARPT